MASVETEGKAALLLDFLGHFDGVAVLLVKSSHTRKSEELLNSKRVCGSLDASGQYSECGGKEPSPS